ncbi:metallophosphoesterase [soil metagenome]
MKVSLLKIISLLLFISASTIQLSYGQISGDSPEMRIVLMADINESYGSTHYGDYVDSAMVLVERWQPDFILFAGDMIAGQSLALSEEEVRAMWAGFDETIGQPLREIKIPFAFTLGNHDGSGSGNFDHERELAKKYWSPHKPELNYINSEHFPFYYSFKFQDLIVISWDASNHLITEEEIEWIEQQLSQDVAKEASKRIMLGHLPLYAVAEGRNREGEILKDADDHFEMMKRNNVDYYFSGHHHAWYPAKKDGLKMIHSGAQGSGPRPLIGSDLPPRRTITLLEREKGSFTFTITTFDLENEMEVISPEELPVVIEGINGRIERYDYHNNE